MRSAAHPRLVAVGVEEEFHIVDLATRRLTGQADRLMGQLPADRFSWEMQRSVVEANSRSWVGLTELAEDIAGEPRRRGCIAPGALYPCPDLPETGPSQRRTGWHRAGTARTERTCHEPLSRQRTTAACRRAGLLDLR